MRNSFREFIQAVANVWWFAMTGILFAAVGAIPNYFPKAEILIPSWAWYILSVIALFVASFIAFHRMRLERDKLQSEDAQLERKRKELEIKQMELDIYNKEHPDHPV